MADDGSYHPFDHLQLSVIDYELIRRIRAPWTRAARRRLLRPRRVGVHVHHRLDLGRRDLGPDIGPADALVARVAAFEHHAVRLLEFDRFLVRNRILDHREAARVDAVEDALQLHVGAVYLVPDGR